jgi:5'-3' exonuclease
MKKNAGQTIMFEGMVVLSENKRRFSLKKLLDNWILMIFICVGVYTLRIAAEELAMKARAISVVSSGK